MGPILILGGGGHARVVLDALRISGHEVTGFLDKNPAIRELAGITQLGDAAPEAVPQFGPADVVLVNGFGSTGNPALRIHQFNRWKALGFVFMTVVHPTAIVAQDTELEEGVQVMAGAVIQPGCHIGANSIINTRVALDHDCKLGPHVHIATGASLSGDVQVGEGAHIGTGASIIQGINIGSQSLVGAGSVVVRDVRDHTQVVGIPAHHHVHTRQG